MKHLPALPPGKPPVDAASNPSDITEEKLLLEIQQLRKSVAAIRQLTKELMETRAA
jgi:hypothetical protein